MTLVEVQSLFYYKNSCSTFMVPPERSESFQVLFLCGFPVDRFKLLLL